jgi:hypothetical protein
LTFGEGFGLKDEMCLANLMFPRLKQELNETDYPEISLSAPFQTPKS